MSSYLTFSTLPDLTGEPLQAIGGAFSVALSVTRTTACPGVTWQPVHGARTFLEEASAIRFDLARDRPASGATLKI